jgi:hypothetical protein
VFLALTAGIALAESFTGTDGPNAIKGTNEHDVIDALADNGTVCAFGSGERLVGNRGDELCAGDGRDRMFGGRGKHYTVVQGDRKARFVDRGSERGVVVVAPQDTLHNCKMVKYDANACNDPSRGPEVRTSGPLLPLSDLAQVVGLQPPTPRAF